MTFRTGYQRLDMMDRIFMSKKLVPILDLNIGKDAQVIISEFLTGDQIGVLQSPYLNPETRKTIHQLQPLEQVWMRKLMNLVIKQIKLQKKCDEDDTEKGQIEKWSHMRLILRYFEMCPPPNIDNPTLSWGMNKIFNKCQEFTQDIPTVLDLAYLSQHESRSDEILGEMKRICRVIKKYHLV